MPSFSDNSKRIRGELRPELRHVVDTAIKNFDFSLICGYRNKLNQERAFASGASRARFGQSPHNFKPAFAFDAIPYPFQGWTKIPPFEEMGKEILDAAKRCGVAVTWGRDFKGLVDYPHFELTGWRNLR